MGGCCAPTGVYPGSPQWHGDHFENPDGPLLPGGMRRLFTPALAPDPRGWLPPQVINDGALLRSGAAAPSLTWIGHATTLLQTGGLAVLTDPVFADHLTLLPRKSPPGVALADLPPIDVVLVSHDHIDHLDADAVRRLRGSLFIVGLGLGGWLRAQGVERVVELDWWQSHTIEHPGSRPGAPPVTIHFVPAHHWSVRCPGDVNHRLWGSFVVESADGTYYLSGDTGYGPHFSETRRRFPAIDLAVLPIGAYEPRDLLEHKHMSPEDARKAFLDLGARWVVPIHWGTFPLGEEPADEPPRRFGAAFADDAARAFVIPIGGVLHLPPRRHGDAKKK